MKKEILSLLDEQKSDALTDVIKSRLTEKKMINLTFKRMTVFESYLSDKGETPGHRKMVDYHVNNLTVQDNPHDDDEENENPIAEDRITDLEKRKLDLKAQIDRIDDELERNKERERLRNEEVIAEDVLKSLITAVNKQGVKSVKVRFSNGEVTDVDSGDARILVHTWETLKGAMKDRFETMLNKNMRSFMMAMDLALK